MYHVEKTLAASFAMVGPVCRVKIQVFVCKYFFLEWWQMGHLKESPSRISYKKMESVYLFWIWLTTASLYLISQFLAKAGFILVDTKGLKNRRTLSSVNFWLKQNQKQLSSIFGFINFVYYGSPSRIRNDLCWRDSLVDKLKANSGSVILLNFAFVFWEEAFFLERNYFMVKCLWNRRHTLFN